MGIFGRSETIFEDSVKSFAFVGCNSDKSDVKRVKLILFERMLCLLGVVLGKVVWVWEEGKRCK